MYAHGNEQQAWLKILTSCWKSANIPSTDMCALRLVDYICRRLLFSKSVAAVSDPNIICDTLVLLPLFSALDTNPSTSFANLSLHLLIYHGLSSTSCHNHLVRHYLLLQRVIVTDFTAFPAIQRHQLRLRRGVQGCSQDGRHERLRRARELQLRPSWQVQLCKWPMPSESKQETVQSSNRGTLVYSYN